jgi:hypothetical protein
MICTSICCRRWRLRAMKGDDYSDDAHFASEPEKFVVTVELLWPQPSAR